LYILWFDGFVRKYSLLSNKSPDSLFHSLCAIKDNNNWFRIRIWKLGNLIEKAYSEIKPSNHKIYKSQIQKNDLIESWRVEDIEPNKLLLLRSEMKLPGRAWVKFEIKSKLKFTKLSVKIYFHSKSFLGHIFWYILFPFHTLFFKNLIRQIETNGLFHYQQVGTIPD